MSFRKFRRDSSFVRERHRSATKKIVGEITYNEKTGNEIK